MEKFQNKYRIPSARLRDWDYGRNGAYFVTICTAHRESFFGNIADGKMNLSGIGNIAKRFLSEIPERYDYAKLDEFVVMPNHVHAIIIIDKNECRDAINRVSTNKPVSTINRVSTNKPIPTNNNVSTDKTNKTTIDNNSKIPGGITGDKNPMLHDNLSRVINWYKGRVSFESRKIRADFAW
jgi:putative transposase